MKTKEELNALKNEVKTLNKKLAELSEEELKLVAGGIAFQPYDTDNYDWTNTPGWEEDTPIDPGSYKYGIIVKCPTSSEN